MATYTIRTEETDGGWIAHIDLDGNICIAQPNKPGLPGFFATKADAQSWAEEHKAGLETANEAMLAEVARKKELEEAQLAAAKAQIQSAQDLAAILAKLTNPSA